MLNILKRYKENYFMRKNIEDIIELIVKAADDKHAQDLEVFEAEKNTDIADYFVICTGTSTTNVKAISDNIEKEMKEKLNIYPHHTEGYREGNWILLDFGNIVVHIFMGETRRFYSLERLWHDAKRLDFSSNSGNI